MTLKLKLAEKYAEPAKSVEMALYYAIKDAYLAGFDKANEFTLDIIQACSTGPEKYAEPEAIKKRWEAFYESK